MLSKLEKLFVDRQPYHSSQGEIEYIRLQKEMQNLMAREMFECYMMGKLLDVEQIKEYIKEVTGVL
jgi:hypothetical protein